MASRRRTLNVERHQAVNYWPNENDADLRETIASLADENERLRKMVIQLSRQTAMMRASQSLN